MLGRRVGEGTYGTQFKIQDTHVSQIPDTLEILREARNRHSSVIGSTTSRDGAWCMH
jgi:hypothetical protein